MESQQRRAGLPPGMPGWPSREPGVPGQPAADHRSGQSQRVPVDCVQRQHRSGDRQPDQRDHYRWDTGQKTGDLLHVPVFHIRASRWVRVEHVRGRQDGAARLLGDLLQLPAIDGRRRLCVLRRLPGIVHAADPLGDVQRHHDGDGRKPDRKPRQREHRRLRTAAFEVAQRERGLPTRHRLQYRCRNSLCRKLHVEPRTNGRCQPLAALRVRQSGKPGEQRAGERELAQSRCMGTIPAWVR